jgi:hypothetical protein
MRLTAEQDRALARLRAEAVVPMSDIGSVVELNAMRDLTKKGLARFAWLPKNCGYVLVSRRFLGVV